MIGQPQFQRLDYAPADHVSPDNPSKEAGYQDDNSPDGTGAMRAYMTVPANTPGKTGAVVVIHENRDLNPYIEDVARHAAMAGFIGCAPDTLTPRVMTRIRRPSRGAAPLNFFTRIWSDI